MNSLWLNENSINKNFESLNKNISTDVCIIGAGIFGLTCGYYLSKSGLKVCILDKNDISTKTTGHTTGKITSQHGLFYTYLVETFGNKFAKDYLFANEEAIRNIKNIIDIEDIKCDLESESSFVYTTTKSDISKIKQEVDCVNSLGFPANFVTKTSLPFKIYGGIQFKNQAQFNPIKYSSGLCNSIIKGNGNLYTNTLVNDIKRVGDNFITISDGGKIESKYVILASHYPFINFPGMYFLKMYQATSYVIGIDSNKSFFDGMYISSSYPVYSFRTANYKGKKILLLGGSNHKTGNSVNYKETYYALEGYARKLYPDCKILFRWNTNDCITLDKIPYIGNFSNLINNLYIGTGFNKWGMSTSNVAANIICDSILGKHNSYSYLFDSNRLNPIKNRTELKNMISESINSFALRKFKHSTLNLENISNNSGGIVEINNKKVGIYKDLSGNLFAVNPICSHLGCLLSWNDVDKTWDCPCHGSRFDYKGKILYGPAIKDLEIYDSNF